MKLNVKGIDGTRLKLFDSNRLDLTCFPRLCRHAIGGGFASPAPIRFISCCYAVVRVMCQLLYSPEISSDSTKF
jgi:hypothetical protein